MRAEAEGGAEQAEAKVRERLMLSCWPALGGRAPEPKQAGSLQELERGRAEGPPLETSARNQPCRCNDSGMSGPQRK